MNDLESVIQRIVCKEVRDMLRHAVRDEVLDMLGSTPFGAALLDATMPSAMKSKRRDTIPAPPPAKKRARRKATRTARRKATRTAPDLAALAVSESIAASTRTATKELRGILLGYFTAPTAPASWTPRELCEAIGGESRDIGRHLQALAKKGDLVLEGSRRNARYRLPERVHTNGASPEP